MKAIICGVFVGKPETIETSRSYQKSDGEPGTSKLAYSQLKFNELPETVDGRVPKWNVAVFRGQNPALESQVLNKFYTEWLPNAEKGMLVELEVQVMPNPKRDEVTKKITDERNGFGGLSLVGIKSIRPVTEMEQVLVAAAFKAEQKEAD